MLATPGYSRVVGGWGGGGGGSGCFLAGKI